VARYQCFRTADRVGWRLLAGNNRILGVAVREHGGLAPAVAEIAAVQDALRADTARITVDRTDTGQWRWSLIGDGCLPHRRTSGPRADPDFVLARSPQRFARRVDARHAALRFAAAAATAAVEPGLAVFEPGRRGRVVPANQSSRRVAAAPR